MNFACLDSKGLYTYANNVGTQAPVGAMLVANNVNCDQIGNTSTRRGFNYYSTQKFTTTNGYITKLFVYENTLYASFNGGQFAQDNGAGTWSIYSGLSMNQPTGGFIHQMLAGGNSYFTTSNGIYKLSGVNSNAPVPAGAPQALDTVPTVTATISSGFLNVGSQCAYSIVWGYTDNSNLLILGAPSQPAYISNPANANNPVNVNLVFSVPPMVISTAATLNWFYQIYRTPNTGSLTVPPGNNYQLVAQANYSSGSSVSYADTTLDSLLGADLYTDSGQTTVGQPYNQPPLAQDIGYFSNMAFYANYSTLQDVLLTLDAVGASLGIQSGDTVTLKDSTSGTSYTYTGGASNIPASRTFAVYTGGTPSVNIQTTAQNLVSVINQDPNNLLFIAQYTSGYAGLPGQMQVTAQNLSQAFFSVTSSRTTCWSPKVPSSGTSYASANTTVQNYLAVSNVSQPESVPPANTQPVGSLNYPIGRIIPVRTGLIVVKPKEGVFLVTGTSPTALTVTTLDTTSFINGSETMAALNNAGYFFTTQGVMLVNESGCEIMSRNIQGDILALASSQYPNFPSLAFGLGYQSDNAYILFLQQNATDTYSTLQYRYNWITQAWTTWQIPGGVTAAIVNPANDRMYLATPQGYILQERKTFTSTDYADPASTVIITAVGTSTLTLSNSLNVNIGDQISQTNSRATSTATVTANNANTGVVTVTSVVGFLVGTATDTAAINSTVTFMPTTCGYPAFIKKFTTWNFEFSQISFLDAMVTFSTDFYPYGETNTLTPQNALTWGTFAWGSTAWGVTLSSPKPISTYSTKNTSIGHWANVSINVAQAFAGFTLSGYVVFFDFLGSRSR